RALPPAQGWVPARVSGEERGFYRLLVDSDSPSLLAEISGKFRHRARERRDYPAVGDFVACVPSGSQAVIHSILPRRSCLSRKEAGESAREQILAANVDTAWIMTSVNQDLNLRRLERYLTLVRGGGAEPLIVLNKIDLAATDWRETAAKLEAVAAGAK